VKHEHCHCVAGSEVCLQVSELQPCRFYQWQPHSALSRAHVLTGMSAVSRTMAGTCLADSSLLIADLTFLTSSSEKLKRERAHYNHVTSNVTPKVVFKNHI